MYQHQDKSKDVESIIAGIYYLSAESYRCGLDRIGSLLRASISYIEQDLEEEGDGKISSFTDTSALLRLLDLINILKDLPLDKKRDLLAMFEERNVNVH